MDFVYRFPVVRGIQAKREYYIAMVPLKMIPKLFPPEEEYVPPEFRAQRKLNEVRIPVISRYILENRENYVFSALAASIDGYFKFCPSEFPDVGVLEISMDAKILINDGQHRKAAILEAISEDESLLNETISVVFFEDQGLARSQQMFTDLNKHAVKTSNSIAELYDSRDELAVYTRSVVSKIKFLNSYTDKEKDILGKYSSNLFTLNTFYVANKKIVSGKMVTGDTESFLLRYWENVVKNIVQWNELENKEISKVDLRENYIVTQAIVIQALGRIGNAFLSHPEYDMEKTLYGLKKIDWKRNAECWQLRAIKANGRMISGETAVLLTANVIKQELGLPLNTDEAEREEKFLRDNRLK
ncbi:MAG: DNA sulfur modification protein DndB [Blautia sp.]|nr:DNA sulfur modification protein DndB [Blautia sp.]